MINGILATWFPPGPPELMLIGSWLLLIILPLLYVVNSIKSRRKILAQLQQLTQEVRLLREKLKGSPPDVS